MALREGYVTCLKVNIMRLGMASLYEIVMLVAPVTYCSFIQYFDVLAVTSALSCLVISCTVKSCVCKDLCNMW